MCVWSFTEDWRRRGRGKREKKEKKREIPEGMVAQARIAKPLQISRRQRREGGREGGRERERKKERRGEREREKERERWRGRGGVGESESTPGRSRRSIPNITPHGNVAAKLCVNASEYTCVRACECE